MKNARSVTRLTLDARRFAGPVYIGMHTGAAASAASKGASNYSAIGARAERPVPELELHPPGRPALEGGAGLSSEGAAGRFLEELPVSGARRRSPEGKRYGPPIQVCEYVQPLPLWFLWFEVVGCHLSNWRSR